MDRHHYILTRFNLCLWTRDKNGQATQTEQWLEKRFELFEYFCLPSIIHQTVKGFKWIVLFDKSTSDSYRKKIEDYSLLCSQFTPYFVSAEEGRYFVRVFRKIILSEINIGDTVITTYLDNDDALRYDYVEEVQRLSMQVKRSTFISFIYGLQYFTSFNIATKVSYRNNHFLSLVEQYEENATVRTVMGYGSHIHVGSYKGTDTLYVETSAKAEWIELVHDTNMDNDVRMTFDTHLVVQQEILKNEYGIEVMLAKNSKRIFYTQFLRHAFSEVIRHIRLKIVGRKWI